jgi:hypothetical protein
LAQETGDLPACPESLCIVADGSSATLTHASEANATRNFPAPVVSPWATATHAVPSLVQQPINRG